MAKNTQSSQFSPFSFSAAKQRQVINFLSLAFFAIIKGSGNIIKILYRGLRGWLPSPLMRQGIHNNKFFNKKLLRGHCSLLRGNYSPLNPQYGDVN